MLYVTDKGFASQLFSKCPAHKEKTLSPGQQKAQELTGYSADSETDLKAIENKLQNGQDLSPAELEYLRKNAPDLYKEAVKIIQLKKQIKKRLEACKTKEQAARERSAIASEIASECGVSPSKKCSLEQAKRYERRINAANNVEIKFAKTEKFINLPDTDGEYAKLKAESRRDKLDISVSAPESDKTTPEEKPEKAEQSQEKDKNQTEKLSDEKKLDAADKKKPQTKKTAEAVLYGSDYRTEKPAFENFFSAKI